MVATLPSGNVNVFVPVDGSTVGVSGDAPSANADGTKRQKETATAREKRVPVLGIGVSSGARK
jgi:hypothetical protein